MSGCGRFITPTPNIAEAPTSTPVSTPTVTPSPQASHTPRIATPIASPTPTVTPTPIIYTIQPGDTLLKIALQFNQSTDAIQEVNGILDPRFLQIGQALIIPQPDEDPNAPPSPTPTPYPLNVTAINFQETQQGTLWGLGEVMNPGTIALTEVVIEASLLDANGLILSREAAYTQLDVIQPGQAVPFAILFKTPPENYNQYVVTAVAAVPLSDQTRYYFELETFGLYGQAEGINNYKVSGQLRNIGSSDVESIRLVTIAYDGEGRVIAQRQANLAINLLRAGATTPFEIDLIIPRGTVQHFEVLAQGLQVQ